MWTRENRGLYERKGARYPSDLSDAEWGLIAALGWPGLSGAGRVVRHGLLLALDMCCAEF